MSDVESALATQKARVHTNPGFIFFEYPEEIGRDYSLHCVVGYACAPFLILEYIYLFFLHEVECH